MNNINIEILKEQLESFANDSEIDTNTVNRIFNVVETLTAFYPRLNNNDWISIIMTSVIYLTNNDALPMKKRAGIDVIKYSSIKSVILLSIEKYIGKENIDYINSSDLHLMENGVYDDSLDEQDIRKYGFSVRKQSKRM